MSHEPVQAVRTGMMPAAVASLLSRVFPNLRGPGLLRQPRREVAGALAGLSASIPQTMAYGAIAVAALGPDWTGLGIVAGLLGAAVHSAVAAALGSNPSTVTGPRAATILVFGAALAQLAALPGLAGRSGGPLVALGLAEVAVVLSGLLQLLFCALRLGRLGGFVPYPVVAGFLNGSALLILAAQIRPLTGIGPDVSLWDFPRVWQALQPGTLALGLGTAAVMLIAARTVRQVPPALMGLAAGTAVYYLLAALGVAGGLGGTIGALPANGLPAPSDLLLILAEVSTADTAVWHILAPAAVSMAALNTLDALLASLALDTLTLRRSDGNRELLAQGCGNVLAGLLWMLPSSGSMARAGALLRGGSRSVLGPLLVAAATLGATIGLGDAVAALPRAVLAGLLVVVSIDLLDKWTMALLHQPLRNWPLSDMLAVGTVVATTLAFNVAAAVAVGMLLALVVFVVRMARTPIRRCYRASALAARIHGDPERLRLIERHGATIAVVEMEGALFFGSVAALESTVETLLAEGVRHVVLDLKRVKDVDATGARTLERLHARLANHGGAIVVAYVERERRTARAGDPVMVERRRIGADRRLWRVFERLGTVAVLGEDGFQPDVDRAVGLCVALIRARLADEGEALTPGPLGPTILRGLDRGARRTLRAAMRRMELSAGETLFRQGDRPDAVFFIASGRVEVTIDLPGTDRKLRVQTLTRGSIFGEMAVLDPKPRSANVAALVPSICYRLGAEDFEALKLSHPALAFRLLENIALIFAERLRATNLLLAELEG